MCLSQTGQWQSKAQGKTKQCLSKVKFPDDWLISFIPNHWCNEITVEAYVCKVIAPFIHQK